MRLAGRRVGVCLTGSHCTLREALEAVEALAAEGAELVGILSTSVSSTTTRFGEPEQWRQQLQKVTGRAPLTSIPEVEPIGPNRSLDVLVIIPCTGNTMAKLANGITDSPVTMAAKAHLRNGRPLVLAISTNDGLGLNAGNLAKLLVTKNVYFVPFGQDNPEAKPNSLVARLSLTVDAVLAALEGKQLQPILIERWRDQ